MSYSKNLHSHYQTSIIQLSYIIILGALDYWVPRNTGNHIRKKINYWDFARKITMMEVNECSLGNMRKIDIFGCHHLLHHADNWGPSVIPIIQVNLVDLIPDNSKESCKIRFRMIIRVHFFHAGHLVCRSIISKGGGNSIYANEDFWVVSLLRLTFEFGQGTGHTELYSRVEGHYYF